MRLWERITILVLTYNEEPNIGRTLDSLRWAPRILVLDSGSTDRTLEIVQSHERAKIVSRPFDSFAGQCNAGLAIIDTEWVLSIDADYEFPPELSEEIRRLPNTSDVAGYMARFAYCVEGRKLRAALYPPRCVLYRRERARYRDEGHGHRVMIDGPIAWLSHVIHHDDRKPLSRWFTSQQNYAKREAEYLLAANSSELGRNDRIRRLAWPAPILVFLYTLLIKRCFLDGWAGWSYALQRTVAEALIALEILDRRLRRPSNP